MNGLGTVPYDENDDLFTGTELFGPTKNLKDKPFTLRTKDDTRLRFSTSGMLEHRREAASSLNSRSRVTRDPNYHETEVYAGFDSDSDPDYDDNENTQDFIGLGPFEKRTVVHDSIRKRKQFLDKYSMQRLKQLLWLGITSGAFPWWWNERNCRIDKWSPAGELAWKFQWFFVTFQTGCLSLFQIYAFFHSFTAANKSYREVFMSSFSLLWYTWAVYFNVNMYIYKDQVFNKTILTE